ncbi:uncharacterized protein I303_103946 [Kwoniella dejecticola CBS 10117]|uniref:Catalase core domain-containing protein n=1 Tax=Kwoniella dejecticola CBS 10117 TaxID=1296121 RepID=A0A1A6A866_9TREE|nr:uncharacterized protein I303_03963 [Kwoniella dejecticola CBS 10117]OBR86243.1 hypothetical protein I303_03963 [Kwoniella dejecticola CBS 10117]
MKAMSQNGVNYHFDKIEESVKRSQSQSQSQGGVKMKLFAQIGEPDKGDTTNDVTKQWPNTRKLVEMGSIRLDEVEEDQLEKNQYIIFDPIPRVKGIEPSDDPLLEMRASLYLTSGKERRAAKVQQKETNEVNHGTLQSH